MWVDKAKKKFGSNLKARAAKISLLQSRGGDGNSGTVRERGKGGKGFRSAKPAQAQKHRAEWERTVGVS